MDTTDLTQKGIQALKAGDAELARKFLRYATNHNPEDLQAWLWLSGAVESKQEKIDCLEKALEIDPHNAAAVQGLSKLIDGYIPPRQASPEYVPPFADGTEEKLSPPTQPTPPRRTAAFELQSHAEQRQRERHVISARPVIISGVISAFFIAASLVVMATFIIYTDIVAAAATIGGMIFFTALVTLLFTVILRALWRRLFHQYKLTTHYLIVDTGSSAAKKRNIPLTDIRGVRCKQSLLGKIFGYGNITIAIHQQPNDLILNSVPDCKKWVKLVQRMVKRAHQINESGH
ncbi:MAG: PH domain-containing protein [Chloroflexi bacterium]|jgi:membrane protein YdbS with pleckstrin-like domain|nr:PH domain-containing protein [Chloroflexota bacterium]